MQEEIYDTKIKQNKREKDFVTSPKRIKVLEKIMLEITQDILDKLKNDKFKHFYWGENTVKIIFDKYYCDSITLWIANGEEYLEIYNNSLLPKLLPEKLRKELWQVINDVKDGWNLGLSYEEYIIKKGKDKTEQELNKLKEIKKAKDTLEKYNIK